MLQIPLVIPFEATPRLNVEVTTTMAFPPHNPGSASAGPSFRPSSFGASASNPYLPVQDDAFDIFQWYPRFQSCVRYFLETAQHTGPVQAVAALINIRLPFQKPQHSAGGLSPTGPSLPARIPGQPPWPAQSGGFVTLTPYIRRLVATGWDIPDILHGFFGDDWAIGIGHIHEIERRNYLFAAKSASWVEVKSLYDLGDEESVPYLRPLQNVTEKEILSAESTWSEWLAMQDWMIGPRSPEVDGQLTAAEKIELND